MSDEAILQEVRTALEQGQRARARDLLTRLLRRDQNQPQYWLWMSAAVETPKERIYCLKEVLRLDPDNPDARRGLILMGVLPPDPQLAVPPALQRRNWQVEVERPTDEAAQRLWRRIALYAGLVVLVVALLTVGILSVDRWRNRPQPTRAPISFKPLPTATPLPQVTTAPREAPLTATPTPPWAALAATYTPTPVYGLTPHPISEAYRLGLRALERRDWDRAIPYLNQVLQSEPEAVDVYYLIGEIYRQQGAFSQALEAYDQAIKVNRDYAPAYLGRARALLLRGNTNDEKDAIRYLKEALRLDPNLAEAHLELAALAAAQQDDSTAAKEIEAAAEQLPNSPLVPYYQAWIALRQGNIEDAIQNAREALNRDLSLLPAYRLLGQALIEAGKPGEAIQPLEVYVQFASQPDSEALGRLAQAYAQTGDGKKALALLDRALAQEPRNVALWIQRGNINLQLVEYESALNDFKTAMKLNARDFAANLGQGRALLGLQAYGDAYMQLSKAEGLAHDESEKAAVYYWRAQAVEPLDPRAAYADWQRLLALPTEAIPGEWIEQAQAALARLATPAPTPLQSATATVSLAPPRTPAPTRTTTAVR